MSIRVRLLLLVLGTALLPAILLGWRYCQDRSKDIESAIGGLAATSRTIAANLDARIEGTTQLHLGLSEAGALVGHDKAACSRFLSEVLSKNPQFTGILTIDANGQLFCDSLRSGRTLDLRDRDYFKRVSQTTGTVIEPVFGRLTGIAVLQIAYPVRDPSARLQFVLLASLDLTRFAREQAENLPPGIEVLLADDKGTVMSWSVPHLGADKPGASIADSPLFRFAADNVAGTRELDGVAGETEVWASTATLPVGGVKLHVMVGRPKSQLVAAPNRRFGEDAAILGILSILYFAGIWLLAEFGIRSQIGRIATMTERFGNGDFAARILPPYPSGELGRLMTIVNGAAHSVERQQHDIEDLNRLLREAQRSETLERQRLDIALDNMMQGLLLFDASACVVLCNQRYLDIYGLSPDQVKPGSSFREVVACRKRNGVFEGDVEAYCSSALRDLARHGVIRDVLRTADGRSIQLVSQRLPDGGWVVTHEDITERARSDERIAHLAHFDPLTDLPNRALFGEQLDIALATIAPGQQLAVLYIDIDEFKGVNDTLGHQVGDELLKAVAARLRGCLKPTDLVARLGGDEFAVIQVAIAGPADTAELVARIYAAIREPFECAGHLLATDASIGIALAPRDGAGVDQLLKSADLAMYAAKADGRRTYRFFESGMDARVKALRALELDLRLAIADGAFELDYQPLVNLATNRISGCEALLRWHHPQRGVIQPAEFIPVAEETGLINPLGEWVLTAACTEAAAWPDHIKVAVNVSPIQFRSPAFALKVAAALAASGLPAHRLELEITEAVLIHDDEAALVMLHQLHALGVSIALDDFGTGYSSLSYLQRFPFDKIKIDRCFIKDVVAAPCFVQAIVTIAAARRMTTTAEGVETDLQLETLRRLGCTEMQGFLYSAAVPAAEILQLLSADRARVAGAA